MMLIRPVEPGDLDALVELSRVADAGRSMLQSNIEHLFVLIQRSCQSFAGELELADRRYVFALEDGQTGKLAGISGIEAALGLREPWYNYRVGTIVHASKELGIYSRHATLFLSNDHTGYSELTSLFLHPDYLSADSNNLLSKARFLFIAQYPELFGPVVTAEMRGYLDADGRSPFWEALGRHFFGLDFAYADSLTNAGEKAFVAELMPKYSVYTDFLPPEAQSVIARTHENSRAARAQFESEGLRFEGYVDIFDAGPTVQAHVQEIRAVRESREVKVKFVDALPSGAVCDKWLVANHLREQFRAILIEAPLPDSGELLLLPEQAARLQVNEGNQVRIVACQPRWP